jgi:hypothetical protein
MKLVVDIHGVRFLALLDSGSTHNFVNTEAAVCADNIFSASTGLCVAVANGDHLTSTGCCRQLPVSIYGEHFVLNCYGVALGTNDTVLGVQWLESLGPILWDFSRHTLAFVRDGHQVVWTASDAATPSPTLLTASDDLMEDLITTFAPLFGEPSGLPPPQQWSHRIQLLPGTAPVAVRPYRYTHAQKAELERQCEYMMRPYCFLRPCSARQKAQWFMAVRCRLPDTQRSHGERQVLHICRGGITR